MSGQSLVEAFAEELGGDVLLAGAHPVPVALQRVDLAVVRDVAERLGQVPRREGVGGEALVDQGEGRLERRIPEVQVELADLVGEQQPLVDERPRREGGDVELAPRRRSSARMACPSSCG